MIEIGAEFKRNRYKYYISSVYDKHVALRRYRDFNSIVFTSCTYEELLQDYIPTGNVELHWLDDPDTIEKYL